MLLLTVVPSPWWLLDEANENIYNDDDDDDMLFFAPFNGLSLVSQLALKVDKVSIIDLMMMESSIILSCRQSFL